MIENEYGKLTWKCELIVVDKPKPVDNLTAEPSTDRVHMLISWKPPRKDIDNPITHYEIEYRNVKNRAWQTLKDSSSDDDDQLKIPGDLSKFEIPINEKETANSLAPNTDYYFRVIVVNSVGKSEPTETIKAVKTPSLPKPPKLKYDTALETCKVVTAQKHAIPVNVEGEPSPQVVWKFIPDGQPDNVESSIPNDVQTEASGPDQDGVNKIALKFRKISRLCDGTYVLTATNSGGEAHAKFRVVVLGLPSAPLNLVAENLSKTSIRLKWSPPIDTGGSQLTNYVIEQAVVKSNVATPSSVGYWEPVTRNLPVHEASDGSTGCVYDIVNLTPEKYMLFRVAAQNKQGVGEYEATKSPLLVTSSHNLPGPPRDLNGKVDKDGQVHLEWKLPQQDGGDKIINYIVEKCSSLKDANWSEIKFPESPDTKRIISKLRDGICYFRVSAVNEAGKGSPSNIIDIDVKKGSDKPDQPGQPTVEVIADGAIQLRWAQPLNEGTGGPIRGYEVQICEVGSVKWKPTSSDLCSANETRLTGLLSTQDYLFRVIAVNDAGESIPSEPSRPIRPATDVDFVRHLENQLITELPTDVVFECELSRPGMTLIWSKDGRDLNLSSRCIYNVVGEGDKALCIHQLTLMKVSPDEQGVYSARLVTGKKTEATLTIECPPKINYEGSLEIQLLSGKSLVVEVPYTGAPFPDVNWSFNNGPLPIGAKRESPIASVDTVYGLTCLRLRHVTGEATGNYKLLISNEMGKATLELTVIVLDIPGPVTHLKATVQNQPSGTVLLTWQAPKDEGGSPIIGYLIEKREANKRSWTPFSSQIKKLSCTVDGLTANTGYFFRVMAQNISGCSQPTETDVSVVIPCLTKPPSAPGTPEASDIGTDSCRVSWEPPSSDGGARLTFYYLEKRANLKGNWVRACADKLPILANDVKSTYVTKVTGLVPDNVYEFRVAAENADFMVGEYSNSSHRISTQLPFSVPGKPSRPEITNITETTIGLAWKAPYDDGGDAVKKYVVQYKTTSSSDWKTVSEMPIDLEFTVAHLQSDEQYEFRVAAINSAGQGPWSDTSDPCNPAKAIESAKPSLVNPLSNVTVLVGQSIELYCDFQLGEPKGNVTWFKDDKPIRSQVKYSTSSAWERRANLKINRAKLEDAGVFSCVAENPSGKAETACRVVVAQKPVLQLELDKSMSSSVTGTSSRLDQLTGRVGGCLVLKATCEAVPDCGSIVWFIKGKQVDSSLDSELLSRVIVNDAYTSRVASGPKPNVSLLTISNLYLSDAGEYGCSSVNEVGNAQAALKLIIHDRPQPPMSIEVTETRGEDWLEVKWERPASDGGLKLTRYVIERRVVAGGQTTSVRETNWTSAGQTGPYDDHLRIKNCIPGTVYSFRIFAENEIGMSDPTEIESPYLMKSYTDLLSPPTYVTAERLSPREAKIQWRSPICDDSDSIQGYMVELRESPDPKSQYTSKWIQASPKLIRSGLTLKVDDLHPDMFVQFRVRARNPIGFSEPSEPSDWIEPVVKKPYESVDGTTRKEDDITKLPKDVKPVLDIVQEVIALKEAVRPKKTVIKGTYCIKATNVAGESSQLIHLIVLAEPLPPKSPVLAKVIESPKEYSDGATVELTWGSPTLRDGESPILGYYVERREGQRRQQFTYPIRLIGADKLSVRIPDLKPGIEYIFRVSSFNDVGSSEPTYSEPLVIKSPYSVPDAPKGPLTCSDLTDSSLKLTWLPPEDNGGLPVKRYYVEMKDVGNPAGWLPLGTVSGDSTSYLVSGLQQGYAYRFRVRAANDEGSGDWLETDKSISFRRPIKKPSQPEGPLRMLPDGDRAVRLTWNAPLDDVCLDRSGEHWQPVGEVQGLNKRIENLIPDGIYSFRVSARNEGDKVGPPLYSEIYKPGAPMTPPGQPVGPLKATCIGIGQVKLEWKPPIVGGQTGCGVPDEYLIERYEQKKARWAYAARQSASTGTSVVISNLQPGSECQFRVRAENRSGSGPFLESDRPITIISPFNPPSPPEGPINISEVQMGVSRADCSARISWRPPIDTGGLPIIRYVLQMRYANTPGWHRVAGLQRTISTDEISIKLDTEGTDLATTSLVTGLMQGQRYIFRVAAVNEVGTGVFLESETFEMPEDDSCKPKADWVRIAGKSADSVTVEWLVPHDCRHDHGPNRAHHLAIDGFRVFVRPATTPQPSNTSQWKQVAELDHYLNRLVVGNLKPNQFYYFGVAAVNQSGQGEIISTKEPVCPEAITTVPSQPIGPLQVTNITDNSCQLSWLSPASDGGSAILGYRIYKREMYRRSWQEIGRITELSGLTSSRQLQFQVQYLMHGTAYEFRVVAENKNGLSEPLDTQAQVHPAKETSVPGPPRGPLRVREVPGSIGTLELSWSPPYELGGLPILGYQLEIRQGRSFNWKSYTPSNELVACGPEYKFQPSHIITDIQPNKEYFFRVSAVNKEGVSLPLTADDSYVKNINLAPPKLVMGRRIAPEDAEYQSQVKPILQVSWEWSPLMTHEPQPTGFQVERLNMSSQKVKWEPIDFIPVSDHEQTNYIHQSVSPSYDGSYKFRVSSVYNEGASQPVETGVILVNPPTIRRPDSTTSSHYIPPVSSVLLRSDSRLGYELEWEAPEGQGAEDIRGYTLEGWDSKKQRWAPLTEIPVSAPRQLSLAAPYTPDKDYKMRIISHGKTGKSIPTEFELYQSPSQSVSSKPPSRPWTTLPSTSGHPLSMISHDRTQPRANVDEDFDLELAMITGFEPISDDVDAFIRSRRQMAQDMTQRMITPSSLGKFSSFEKSRLDLDRPESSLYSTGRMTAHSNISTPAGLYISDQLRADVVSPTSVHLVWPEPNGSLVLDKVASYDIQKWEPTYSKWVSVAKAPSRVTDYTVTGLRSTDESGWWFRVVPLGRDAETTGAPYQMAKPIYPRSKNATVPSSVWGVEISSAPGLSNMNQRTIQVNWMKPSNDGGSDILGYRLIIYDADTGADQELIVSPKTLCAKIDSLEAFHVCRITITAFNRIGDSIPVTSTVPVHPATPGLPPLPLPPSDFRAILTDHFDKEYSNCILSWKPPSSVSSLPVDFYVIEKWSSQSKQWIPFKKVPFDVFEIEITHLIDDVDYGFRIRSQNVTGLSEPLCLNTHIRPNLVKEKGTKALPPPAPGSPLELIELKTKQSVSKLKTATDVANRVMELCWSQPTFLTDEVGPIRGYVVEARRRGQDNWALLGRLPATRDRHWNIVFGPQTGGYTRTPTLPLSHPPSILSDYTDKWEVSLPHSISKTYPSTSMLLGEPKDYEFRLYSENEFGLSEPIYLRPKLRSPYEISEPRYDTDSALEYYELPTHISPPRGPLRMETVPKAPLYHDKIQRDNDVVTSEDLILRWKPPYDTTNISGYEVIYRTPYDMKWQPIGRTDLCDTSLIIPSSLLSDFPQTVHIGVRSVGDYFPGTIGRPYSETVEEVLSVPQSVFTPPSYRPKPYKTTKDAFSLRAPSEVRASVFKYTFEKDSPEEVAVAWRPPSIKSVDKHGLDSMPDSYLILARELGHSDWKEVQTIPSNITNTYIRSSLLPEGRDIYIGVAPVRGIQIGPIMSTLDTIKLSEPKSPERLTSKSSLPFVFGEPLTTLPEGPDAIRVQWKPTKALLGKLPYKGIADYRLEMRRPYEMDWKPIGIPKYLDLMDGIIPVSSPVEYKLDNLKPGERIELRVATRPSRTAPSIPVTDTLFYQFIPPYDVPSKPRGPLMVDVLPTYYPTYSRRPSSSLERVETPLSFSAHTTPFLDSKSFQLKWHAPLDTGGLPVTEYVIERRGGPVKSTSNEWIPVLSVSGETTSAMVPLPSTRTGVCPYSFRVRAVNRMGASSPLETSRPLDLDTVMLDQTSRPSSCASYRPLPPAPPSGPLRSEFLPFDAGLHLEWQHPQKDYYKLDESPSMPSTYVIEATEASRPDAPWIEVGRVPGTAKSADVRLLPPLYRSESTKSTYTPNLHHVPPTLLYRIRGENEFGVSAPLVTRIEPLDLSLYGSKLGLEYPRLSPGRLETHLIPTLSESRPPRIELRWPSIAPEYRRQSLPSANRQLITTPLTSDISYLVQVRKAEDIGWQTIASLPFGQETFTYYPKVEKIPHRPRSSLGSVYKLEEKPMFEGYQFRVAPRSHLGIGRFLESDVVSWSPSRLQAGDYRTVSLPGPMSMELLVPSVHQPIIPPPERFHLVDVSTEPAGERIQNKLGSVTLSWHPPTGMPSNLRSTSDFVVESWRSDKQEWWPIARRPAAISAESVPGRYEIRIDGLPLGQTYHFRVLTETRDDRSEPVILPQPVFMPQLDTEQKAIPAPPSHLRVSSLTGSSNGALLTWLPPSNVTLSGRRSSLSLRCPPTGYILEYCSLTSAGDEPTKWKRLAVLDAWETSYQTTDLEPDTRYLFRIMSRGKISDSLRSVTPSKHGRISRTSVDLGVVSEATHSEIFEIPRKIITVPKLTGDLTVKPITSVSTVSPSVSLHWQPIDQPLTGYILDLYDLKEPTGWKTITRINTTEIHHPFYGVTVTGLIPDHSYRFRVIPYKDDLFGRPLETLKAYTVPKALGYDDIDYESLVIPPPRGPLHVESVGGSIYRLSWLPAQLRSLTDIMNRSKLDNEIEYIIEQQTPHRRFWLEVGRTCLTDYVLPINNAAVRFRIRTGLADISSSIDKRTDYSLSYDGLLSEWIHTVDDNVQYENIPRVGSPKKLLSDATVFDIGRIVPDGLRVLHIGQTSALLEWDPLKINEKVVYPYYLILERRIINKYKPSIWEPIARIRTSDTTYEVRGLSSGTTYDFRLVGIEESTKTRSTKYCQLPKPFTTLGRRDSLEDMEISWIDQPRLFNASSKVDGTQEGIMLTWKSPEMPNHLDEKLLYRIEVRGFNFSGEPITDWTKVISELKSTQYFISYNKLDNLFSQSPSYQTGIQSTTRRRHIRSIDLEQQQWQFRVFAELDDKQSLPAVTITPITLIPQTKRSPLRFINLRDDRIIYAVHGQKLVLSVEVEGDPKPNVFWYLNHIQIDDKILPGCRVAQIGVGIYELTIERIQKSHAGFLECRVWNIYESISETWELIVSAVPRFCRLGWTAQPHEYELRHGDSWYLRVPLEGLDYIQDHEWITKVWFERLSHPAPGLSIEPLENRVRLNLSCGCRWVEVVVDKLNLADSGLYRLWIQNQAGRDYIDLRLRIADKPYTQLQKPRVKPHGPGTLLIEWSPPVISDRLESLIKFTGYRVEYRCDKSGEDWCLLGSTSADQTYFTAGSQLRKGVNYRFRVRLENWHGLGPASDASEPVQLPTHRFTEVLNLNDMEYRHYTDGSFESRYDIIEELARTRSSRLYRLAERSTGRNWLATIIDTSPSALTKRPATALGKRDISFPQLPPRPVSVMEIEHPVHRRASYDISKYTTRHDVTDWEQEKAERELKLISRIQQDSFARLHETYTEAKRTICVMEDVTAGDTLWHQLGRRIAISENKAADILRQLLDLTAQIHKSGGVHLGLQPENIFFTDQSRRRIALADLGQTYTSTIDKPVRLSFRSMVYIPPELTSSIPISKSTRVGQSADMWSLGLLLYQMATGDTEGSPEPQKLENLHYSSKMVDFTKRLLHSDPKQRMTVHQALEHPWITSMIDRKDDQEEKDNYIKSITSNLSKNYDSQIHDEIIEDDIAERINKRAYTRLLRWLDASYVHDSNNIDITDTSTIRKLSRGESMHESYHRSYYDYQTSSSKESEEIVVHARITPRGQAPEIFTPLGSVSAAEGSTTMLRCAVYLPKIRKPSHPTDQMSDLQIRWSLNGRELNVGRPLPSLKTPSTQHYVCTYDTETGDIKLHINNVTVYDAGTYEVTVIGRYGQVSDSANLKVYESTQRTNTKSDLYVTSELGARILLPLVDMTCTTGGKVQMKAKVGGVPVPRCTWLHNGVPLTASSRRRFYQEDLNGPSSSELMLRLEISDVTTGDAGLYSLVATNKYGSQTCSAIIEVYASLDEGSEAPHFLKELTSITVVEGSAARFETCARGQPTPTVRWLKDGKPLLTDGIRINVSQTSTERSGTNTSSHTLLVKEAIPRDSGTYTCIATSSSGTAITEAALHVRGLFGRGSHMGSDLVNGVIRHRHPEFTRRLRNQQVDLGSTIRLAASVLAQPSATVVWQKDGVEILTEPPDDPRITAKNHSGHLELRIENVCKEDLGQYTVIAYNAAGEARCSCILQGATKMEIQVPRFIKELRDYTVLEGTNLCLEATAIGEPIPEFKWEKDGFEILPDEYGLPHITPGTNGNGSAYLRIHNVRSSDAGLYRCTAYNRFGREKTTGIVYVESTKEKGTRRSDMMNGSINSFYNQSADSSLILLSSENGIKASPREHSDSPKLTGYLNVLCPLPKTVDVEEGDPMELTCRVSTNLHYIPTWSKSGRTLTYDGRRRITRSKDGELTLAIDQIMSNDGGCYTLTLEASDANAPKNLEPIVLSTRVEVKSKQKLRYDVGSRGSSRTNSRATSISTGRASREP
ncbi:hypothetical protein MN116_000743 [Schistosoma mekongi]|uniref:Titin n=1 Tax=Schistosoma mekongi TaxID=38744 RepID=A0AAE1ZIU1_SCHME|nr:hypothetical protein MN116_000743 [Schistosoma mekongi]